ncbi:MAG: biliverdin-producing heme oxygenase [Myxococcales bacterium]|nr:biliverdin-producing heme oxygenase [Myxococcales bacterium]
MAVSTLEALRVGTRAHPRPVGSMVFLAELAAGRLSLEGYVSLLRSLRALFAAAEGAAAAASHPAVAAVFSPADSALTALAADLAALDTVPHRILSDAELRATAAAQDLRVAAASAPLRSLGHLYVLAGVQREAAARRGQVAAALGLAGPSGVAFVTRSEAGAAGRWRSLSARLDGLALTRPERAVVVAGAVDLLGDLSDVVSALPSAGVSAPSGTAIHLNREAGSHPVTGDPRELAAALRAGERTWAEHPYYEQRYGERGRRFTRSDSGWLVTLTAAAPAVVEGEVAWLARLLAARGMPRLLMERHLLTLHAELVAAVPDEAPRYAKIAAAARALGDARREWVGDARLAELGRRFDAAAGPALAAALPGVGELLGGAVADERHGLSRAVPSLTDWLTDRARFPERWAAAVTATLAAARDGARGDASLHP